jgi:hypothetical protein
MSHRAPCDSSVCGMQDGVRINTMKVVQIWSGSDLAAMFNAKRLCNMALDGAEPRQSCRMAINDRDDGAVARQWRQQALNVTERTAVSPMSKSLCRLPADVKTLSGSNVQNPDTAPIFSTAAF